MESSINTVLIYLAIFFHLQGWNYAIQILHQPTEHGWTWTSVGTGTSMIAVGEMFAIFVLYHFDSLTIIPILFVPPIVLLLFGIPMAITQIFKKLSEDRQSKKINETHDFDQE